MVYDGYIKFPHPEHILILILILLQVPYLEDWVAFEGGYDVWCTSTEFLDLCAGDTLQTSWRPYPTNPDNNVIILTLKVTLMSTRSCSVTTSFIGCIT